MTPDPLSTLTRVNESLRSALGRFCPAPDSNLTVTPDDFANLLADLLRAGECLREVAANPARQVPRQSAATPALDHATREYYAHLETLKNCLPDLHTRLLAERSRLRTAQAHATAVGAWVRANTKTL